MVTGDPNEQECRTVEGRIADALSRLARSRRVAGDPVPPPAYVRRHAVEHAAAAGGVDGQLISSDFLPYVDAERLRALNPTATGAEAVALLRLWRQAAHGWEWDSPEANASALAFWARCADAPLPRTELARHWTPQWAQWPLGNGEILTRLPASVGTVATAALPDGRLAVVVSSHDGTVSVWDLDTGHPIGEPVTTAQDHAKPVATAVLPDGRAVVVAGSEDGLWMWDPTEGGPTGDRVGGTITSLVTTVLPDRRVVAIAAEALGLVHVWDITAGRFEARPVQSMDTHSGLTSVLCVATLPDGRAGLLSAGGVLSDNTVRIWDLVTGEPAAEPLQHGDTVTALTAARLPDGRTVVVASAVGRDRRVWDLTTGNCTSTYTWSQALTTFELPDGRPVVIEAVHDYTLHVWDPSDGSPVGPPLHGHADIVQSVTAAVRPDGRRIVVSGGNDGTVRCWDLTTRPRTGRGDVAGPYPLSSVVSARLPSGRDVVVAGGRDMRTAYVTDLASGDSVGGPLRHRDRVLALATAEQSDGRTVVLAGGRDNEATVLVWDLAKAEAESRVLSHGASTALATACLPDGRTVAITGHFMYGMPKPSAAIRVRDLLTGETMDDPLTGPAESVEAAATATLPDGRVLLIASTSHIETHEFALSVWDLETRRRHGSLHGCTDTVSAVATASLPQGRSVAVTGEANGTVRLWDLGERRLIGSHHAHQHRVEAVATATLSDGRPVAVTGGGATLWLWDLSAWESIGPPLRLPGRVYALATARLDGRTVAAVAGDGLAVVHLEPDSGQGEGAGV
ncbi:WD40 repeat domain-containing protein [Streptomyces chartreusis]|uniref:WD40 repeat domain-containing protein n=1 Tax=Streptomyces chartreusis TaxID=1969 RepID=UPI0033EDABC4